MPTLLLCFHVKSGEFECDSVGVDVFIIGYQVVKSF